MTRVIISAFFLVVTVSCYSQNTSLLFQDNYVKVSFKPIDDQYGYIIEDYDGMYGGTLVKYTLTTKDFIIEELDSMIIVDSMLFYQSDTYKKDSAQLSFRFRTNEFDGHLTDQNLTYIINDSLEFQTGKLYKNDQFHRVLIPIMGIPYKLEIKTGAHTIGPFKVTARNDISCKVVILISKHLDEFDHGKLLPTKISFKNKTYNLKHNFIAWD